jgi:hypothetical protein
MELLGVLTSRHAGSLRELRLSEIEQAQESSAGIPQDLITFECRSISDGEAVGNIVQANQSTLQTLSLGQDKSLVEQYRRTRVGFLDQIPQPLKSFKHALQLSDFPNLRQLDLCGLNVSPLVPASFDEAVPFCRLTRLSLESCVGSAVLLESLAGTFYFVQNAADAPQPRITPQLTEFFFRSEAPTTLLKESMIRFFPRIEDVVAAVRERGPLGADFDHDRGARADVADSGTGVTDSTSREPELGHIATFWCRRVFVRSMGRFNSRHLSSVSKSSPAGNGFPLERRDRQTTQNPLANPQESSNHSCSQFSGKPGTLTARRLHH